jgi:2-iminobutanoate/2-iminopropanoate deaminase
VIETFNVEGAPPAVGPYSHGVLCSGTMLFLSGQVALLADGSFVDGDVTAQTEQVFKNISLVLASQGATLADVVKTTVLLATMDDFAAMNTVYADTFGEHRPARSAFAVARLPKDALVEIEVIACRA